MPLFSHLEKPTNMLWTIVYYSEEARLEIDALPADIRASYTRLTELLEEFGLDLRMAGSPAMEGGLFELRLRGREELHGCSLHEDRQEDQKGWERPQSVLKNNLTFSRLHDIV